MIAVYNKYKFSFRFVYKLLVLSNNNKALETICEQSILIKRYKHCT